MTASLSRRGGLLEGITQLESWKASEVPIQGPELSYSMLDSKGSYVSVMSKFPSGRSSLHHSHHVRGVGWPFPQQNQRRRVDQRLKIFEGDSQVCWWIKHP